MKQLIREMTALFASGQSFALATVVTRNGSAPRSAGAKMLVRADGSTAGTVGGGMLEAQVEQLARQVLQTHQAVVQGFAFSGRDAASMDAICGGHVEVLVEWLDAGSLQEVSVVKALQDAVAGHRKAWLVTALPLRYVTGTVVPGHETASSHALVHPDGSLTGRLPEWVDQAQVIALATGGPGVGVTVTAPLKVSQWVAVGPGRLMVEPLDIAGTVFIFGAGHVSRSLAEFTKAVGFWTVVLDDRAEYATPERFPTADERVVLESFSDSVSKIEVEPDSFIVIVTRGHLHDQTVLTQALKSRAGYIGMIGSRRKCGLIFEELRKEGFSEADIQRVHAPIGLPIEAETPEEIGISIVAELIQVRSLLTTGGH
jgi:xanthine dehydrogenase accessory factor